MTHLDILQARHDYEKAHRKRPTHVYIPVKQWNGFIDALPPEVQWYSVEPQIYGMRIIVSDVERMFVTA